MTKVTKPLFSFTAVGRLTRAVTFKMKGKQAIAEKTPVVPDAKSPGQLAWRPMFLLAIDLWHALSASEKRVWESAARPHHLTGYMWFISQALRPNPGLYLPLLGGTMQGDIAMAGFKIGGLPDPAAAQEAATKAYIDAGGAGHIVILPVNYTSIGQGTWRFNVSDLFYLNGSFSNPTHDDGDNISYKAYLAAGTYTLRIISSTNDSFAILDFDIDAEEVASFDLYTAGLERNIVSSQSNIVVASAGLKTIKMRVDGKNGASTDYNVDPQIIALWRTA